MNFINGSFNSALFAVEIKLSLLTLMEKFYLMVLLILTAKLRPFLNYFDFNILYVNFHIYSYEISMNNIFK